MTLRIYPRTNHVKACELNELYKVCQLAETTIRIFGLLQPIMSSCISCHMTDEELTTHRGKLHRQAARAIKSFKLGVELHRRLKLVVEQLIENGFDQDPLDKENMIDVLEQLLRAAQICTSDTFAIH